MQLVAQYRRFATDCRHFAATLSKPADKQALELLQALELIAIGWERSAENREAMLRGEVGAESVDLTNAVRYFFRVAMGLNYETLARNPH
jgi:hypothetical protein